MKYYRFDKNAISAKMSSIKKEDMSFDITSFKTIITSWLEQHKTPASRNTLYNRLISPLWYNHLQNSSLWWIYTNDTSLWWILRKFCEYNISQRKIHLLNKHDFSSYWIIRFVRDLRKMTNFMFDKLSAFNLLLCRQVSKNRANTYF